MSLIVGEEFSAFSDSYTWPGIWRKILFIVMKGIRDVPNKVGPSN